MCLPYFLASISRGFERKQCTTLARRAIIDRISPFGRQLQTTITNREAEIRTAATCYYCISSFHPNGKLRYGKKSRIILPFIPADVTSLLLSHMGSEKIIIDSLLFLGGAKRRNAHCLIAGKCWTTHKGFLALCVKKLLEEIMQTNNGNFYVTFSWRFQRHTEHAFG